MSKTTKSEKKVAAAQKLELEFAAISLSFNWMGMKRTLSTSQRQDASAVFGAEYTHLAASKKLLDNRHPALLKLTGIKNEMYALWKNSSLPYTEEGIRLFPKKTMEKFLEKMEEMKVQFYMAVSELDGCYAEMVDQAKMRLGTLYNPSDYPSTLSGSFGVEWNFHNVSPPDYLMHLNPQRYEEEHAKMKLRFQEAVGLAEQAFKEEFLKIIEHLQERLGGHNEKGERNILQARSLDNIKDFFDRFKALNINSNPALDKLVEDAKKTLTGVDASTLKYQFNLRDQLASQMGEIKEKLDGMVVAEPRRHIIRPKANPTPNGTGAH